MLIVVNLLVDTYIYIVLRKRCKTRVPALVQLVSAIALCAYLVVTVALPRNSGSDSTLVAVMWMLFGYLTVYASKLVFVIYDAFSFLPLLFRKKRSRAASWIAGFLAVAVFLGMWWGALVNRYRIQVREVDVEIEGLPSAFDGYRIVQFSDLHTGTYRSDTSFVAKTVSRINSLEPDLIVFTGDIVNRRTDELLPFVSTLSRLDAPDGVYSILGNHDYGDYSTWPTAAAKEENMRLMYDLQQRMGWKMLNNDHDFLRRDNDSIALIGVENVGDPPFKCYGSLGKAYPAADNDVTKILLSHNPAHWLDSIAPDKDISIDLTLSGHTHAMQIEVLGLSPAVFRYPAWGGLYGDAGKRLYVNIGMGTVGIPMRFGATPEITVITLHSSHKTK
ncbi:MAG: metallophosphoesterase [Paramuribaculum sp.]|nr:metallophosphoesterase [Paramuribaculum sp.]